MNKITTRSVIQALATIPEAGAGASFRACAHQEPGGNSSLSSTSAKTDKTTLVNVVLHGMFAMIFDNRKPLTNLPLLLMAPCVDSHVYGAGMWRQEVCLKQGSSYELQGLQSNSSFNIDDYATNPLVTFSNLPGWGSSPYCSLQLPFPDDMVPLRKLTRPDGGPPFFDCCAGPYGEQICTASELPMIYVLKYKNALGPQNPIQLFGSVETQGIWSMGSSPVNNLHIFAEPLSDDIPGHLEEALCQINKMFDPNLGIASNPKNSHLDHIVPRDKDTGDPNVTIEEESTLNERHQGLCGLEPPAGQVRSGAPQNCMKLLFSIS
jgi:hypothetical protein